jgi:hypothetical protein
MRLTQGLITLVTVTLLTALPAPGQQHSDGAGLTPIVRAAVDQYVSSWSRFSVTDYEPLLHSDFVFTPTPSKGGANSRWNRETELEIARDLFTGSDGAPRLQKWDVSYEVVSTRESWEFPGAVEVLCNFSIDVERDGKSWTSTNRSFLVLVPETGSGERYQILRWTEIELS